MTDDVERFPVLVSDEERAKIRTALTRYRDSLDSERTRLTKLEVDTDPVDDALGVVKGDGVSGGLLNRFKSRQTQDLFDNQPKGRVRRLHGPDPEPVREDFEDEDSWRKAMDEYAADGAAVTKDPLHPDRWDEREVLMGKIQENLDTWAEDLGGYLEDEDGQVWQLAITTDVGLVHIGRRPSSQVDAAVEASEAEKSDPDQVEQQKLEQLRGLVVNVIQEDATEVPVPDRERAVAYAQETTDRDWLRAWATGETPEPPEDWEPGQDPEESYPWQGVPITPAAQALAQEKGMDPGDVKGIGTGNGGRILKGDVEELLAERSRQA